MEARANALVHDMTEYNGVFLENLQSTQKMIMPLMQMLLYTVPSLTGDLNLQPWTRFELQFISPTYNTA